MLERLIIGTGAAAAAAAMALRKQSLEFEVVDAGFDLETERAAAIANLSTAAPHVWDESSRDFLFPPAVASARGVEKRFAFGSDFPYRMPSDVTLTSRNCKVEVSHGRGGFGNVWGAAVLPYAASETSGWPVPRRDLEDSFREISEFVPISGEVDGLAQSFPLYGRSVGHLPRTPQTEFLLRELKRRQSSLRNDGIEFGRARVAVSGTGQANGCRRCGHCLEGCVYGSIFNPRNIWLDLERSGVRVHSGFQVLEFQEHADYVVVRCRASDGRGMREFTARRVFIATGAVSSTRIVARSLGLEGRTIRLLDSQYFFFPWITYRALPTSPIEFTLAEAFIEVLNRKVGERYVHFQVYGLNEIFRNAIRGMVPKAARWGGLVRQLENRFFLFQGFLHSDESGHLEFRLTRNGDGDHVEIVGVSKPESRRVARQAQALIRRKLIGSGLVPPVLEMVPLGRSFHIGGSFPMGASDPVFSSDALGRPAGSRRVHLLDAATFPSIPATTITFSIMANADRIARLSARHAGH